MLFQNKSFLQQNNYRALMTEVYRQDENTCLEGLIAYASLPPQALNHIQVLATDLVKKIRADRLKRGGLDAFLIQYELSTQEGIALMCLAEALLRIPDNATRDKLIKDKITTANWA